jgi:hypothetical protein
MLSNGAGSRSLLIARALSTPFNCRAFAMAYVLARQDTGCKLSAPKTNTPLNALFCGVFRLYLLTSPAPQMSYLTDSGVLRAVSLEIS